MTHNRNKKRPPVTANDKVKRYLIDGKYTEILLEFDTFSIISRFGSEAVAGANRHLIPHPLVDVQEREGFSINDVRFFVTGDDSGNV